MEPKCLDIRNLQTRSGPAGAAKLDRHGAMVIRDRSAIDAICLHQTAITFGVSPSQVRKAGGDAMIAQFMRAKDVHAHVTAFDEGTFVPAYPLRAYVYHGNGSNARSVGLECEGLFNGLPGGKNGEPSDLLIETARAACTWLVTECALDGITLKHIVAHRQYAASRRADPGWKLWQAVAVDHCEKRLGLTCLPLLTDRDGRAIPKEWDPRQDAAY